jgi:clan AA aspartic protease (TIGR02281 family)
MVIKTSVLIFVAAILMCMPPLGWCGDIYKYVDEQGNVHFTDTPPPPEKKLELQKVYKLKKKGGAKGDSGGEGSTDLDRIVIPFQARAGGMSARMGMFVNVNLSRAQRNITRQFLVDTGASVTVITRGDAGALGIREEDVLGSGLGKVAGGGTVAGHAVQLSSLQVGDMVVRAPMVVVLTSGESRLLGMDILGRYNIKVDHDSKLLVLERR